ncbi:MAG: four helix bundle protein [Candidatus Cloacimonetes bacterium]|nr:four helix bundle protein [Candidatus Cloacimonadota bacterium]
MQKAKSKDTNKNSKKDLKVKAYCYALKIIHLLERLPKDYITQTIGKQLLRSATSIGANTIEAQSASSKKDFTNFLNHALKSANESKFWLGLLRDSKKVNSEIINPLLQETHEFANILGASILTVKGERNF